MSTMTFNCPYLNINNVPIKVNHLHVGNETSSTAIKKGIFCPFSASQSKMTIIRQNCCPCVLGENTDGSDIDKHRWQQQTLNETEIITSHRLEKVVTLSMSFYIPLDCLCIGVFGVVFLQKYRSLWVVGSSCCALRKWGLLDVSSGGPGSVCSPGSAVFFALVDLSRRSLCCG